MTTNSILATGSISLSLDGNALLAPLLAGGSTTLTLLNLVAGTHNLSAAYPAGNFADASGTGSVTVNKAALTVTADNLTTVFGQPIVLTYTVTAISQ